MKTGKSDGGADYTKTWQALSFNDNGKVSSYQEIEQNQASGYSNLIRENIVYDEHGFLIGYNEQGLSGGAIVNKVWSSASENYDSLGRVLEFTEAGITGQRQIYENSDGDGI